MEQNDVDLETSPARDAQEEQQMIKNVTISPESDPKDSSDRAGQKANNLIKRIESRVTGNTSIYKSSVGLVKNTTNTSETKPETDERDKPRSSLQNFSIKGGIPPLSPQAGVGVSVDAISVDSNNNSGFASMDTYAVRAQESDNEPSDEVPQCSVTPDKETRQSEKTVASPDELMDVCISSGEDKKGGKRRKPNRRGSAWTDLQTDFLFEVWALHSQSRTGEEFGVHNAPIYRLISRAMTDVGYGKSAEQCKTRIHTLKRAYKLTKDEIQAGNQSITYCRHIEKLEIIMGDSPNTTAQELSDSLAAKRRSRVLHPSTEKRASNRRSRGHSGSKAKRTNKANNTQFGASVAVSQPTIAPTPHKQIVPAQQSSPMPVIPNSNVLNSFWNVPTVVSQSTPYPYALTAALQSPVLSRVAPISKSNQTQSSIPQPVITLESYPQTHSNSQHETQKHTIPEVNNNDTNVKEEKQPDAGYGLYEHSDHNQSQPETKWPQSETKWAQPDTRWAQLEQQQHHQTNNHQQQQQQNIQIPPLTQPDTKWVQLEQPQQRQYNLNQQQQQNIQISPLTQPEFVQKTNAARTKEDLERLKLDLEMRKLEMERTKLEMEERQRREEREHQYRMMQLLLHGLGQQNSAAGSGAGQMADLSRAIENGLVPGGVQGANEKGLSFNEI